MAHWGSTTVTGRGLLALSGKGLIHQISLKTGEAYVVSPRNVIAYSMMQRAPQPYRFKSNNLRLQIPNPFTWLPDTRCWRTIRDSTFYKLLRDASFTVRTWARRTIWGDGVCSNFRCGSFRLTIPSSSFTFKDQPQSLCNHERQGSATASRTRT